MLTVGEITAMQEAATAALPDTITITRDPGTGSLNTETGAWTPDPPSTIYSGVGRVRTPTAEEIQVIFGDRQVTETSYVVTIPADAGDVQIGDIVTVSASDDPHIDLRSFRVVRTPAGSWLINRRLGAETVE